MDTAVCTDGDLFVAGYVCAVDVVVARGLAVDAVGEDFAVFRGVDWDGDAFVENVEFAFPVCIGELLAVHMHAAVELVDVFEAFVFKEGCCCFAADAAGAVSDYFFILVFDEFFFNNFRELFKVLHWERDGVFETSDCCFVVVAHVDDDKVFIAFVEFVKVFWLDVCAGFFVWIQCLFVFHCYQLFAVTYEDFFEAAVWAFALFDFHVGKERVIFHVFNVLVGDLFWAAAGSVDAVISDENSAFDADGFAKFEMFVGELLRVWDTHVLIVEEYGPGFFLAFLYSISHVFCH